MKEVLRLLREAMPEIVGGLVVATILALISMLYAGLGTWPAVLAAVTGIVLVTGLWLLVSRRQLMVPVPSEEPALREPRQVWGTSEPQQTVLFVDDDIEIIGAAFITLLKQEGLNVAVATTASQAIRIIESDQPLDLIVADLMMPPGDGYKGRSSRYMGIRVCEAARKLRGDIPIIVFSVVRDTKALDEVRKLDIAAHLQKPILPSEFLEQVKLALVRANAPSEAKLVYQEIERRKIELQSSYPSTRLRALWALGQIGHRDATVLTQLDDIAEHDHDAEVRAAAKNAAKSIRRKLRQGETQK